MTHTYTGTMIMTKIGGSQICRFIVNFVPHHEPVCASDVEKLRSFVFSHADTLVLTGAGVSTESGIPDYRSKDVGLYARSNHKPMTYQEFTKNSFSRRRYWARSFVAWPRFSSVSPNCCHTILKDLESQGYLSHIITQNVDNLHFKAGCEKVIELHGTLYRVVCTSCREYSLDRNVFQQMLKNLNPWMTKTSQILRPDGDVELNEDDVKSFVIPPCQQCGGFLKPDVVFFGENVPAERVNRVSQQVTRCSSLLVLGSSLSTFSAYRIILQAVEAHKPVCIVNIGESRADSLVKERIEARCGEILLAAFP